MWNVTICDSYRIFLKKEVVYSKHELGTVKELVAYPSAFGWAVVRTLLAFA
jgi:hypothetical protein